MPDATPIPTARDDAQWPELPLASWRDTYATLHMWTQIVGKTRLALAPMENHWWQATMYVTDRGLTTSPMPWRGKVVVVDFDFVDHALVLRTSEGEARRLALAPMSVASFYADYTNALESLGVTPMVMPKPVEVEPAIPFAQDVEHASYDAAAVNRWWRALLQVDRVFKLFRSSFTGKQSPAHFFWGSFDHACTRFSGRTAPPHPGGRAELPGPRDGRGLIARMQQRRLLARRRCERGARVLRLRLPGAARLRSASGPARCRVLRPEGPRVHPAV